MRPDGFCLLVSSWGCANFKLRKRGIILFFNFKHLIFRVTLVPNYRKQLGHLIWKVNYFFRNYFAFWNPFCPNKKHLRALQAEYNTLRSLDIRVLYSLEPPLLIIYVIRTNQEWRNQKSRWFLGKKKGLATKYCATKIRRPKLPRKNRGKKHYGEDTLCKMFFTKLFWRKTLTKTLFFRGRSF